MVERGDENLSIADLPGPRPSRNGLNGTIHVLCRYGNFDAKLGQEVHRVFGAAVDFRVPLLSPVAFDFRYGHSAYPEPAQRLPDFVELEWLDYRDDEFHCRPPPIAFFARLPSSRATDDMSKSMPDAEF